ILNTLRNACSIIAPASAPEGPGGRPGGCAAGSAGVPAAAELLGQILGGLVVAVAVNSAGAVAAGAGLVDRAASAGNQALRLRRDAGDLDLELHAELLGFAEVAQDLHIAAGVSDEAGLDEAVGVDRAAGGEV